MAETTNPGEEKAWEILASITPDAVCRAAAVSYDAAVSRYRVASFGMDFEVSVKNRTITSAAPGSELLLQRLAYFFRLSLLWHLANAKELPLTGRLVKIGSITGGEAFTKGSHVLPLDPLAAQYGKDRERFLERGKKLGGEPAGLGDASLRLRPLPRMPVVLSLWLEDDEFPARADLFFDSTCELQAPPDIVWSVAMMTVLVMM